MLCFSCPVDKGLGGPLACLKKKILNECRDFHAWRAGILTEDDGKRPWNEENIDEQGKPYFTLWTN